MRPTVTRVELQGPAQVDDGFFARLVRSERETQIPVRRGGIWFEAQRFAKLRDRAIEFAFVRERGAKDVVHLRRFGDEGAQIGAAVDPARPTLGEEARASRFAWRRRVSALEQSKIRVEPQHQRRRLPVREAFRAPGRDLSQVSDRRR